jgi:hypothetical protein
LAAGWTTERSEFESQWVQEFFLLHVVEAGSAPHPASYPMCTGALSSWVNRPRLEADHSPIRLNGAVKRKDKFTFDCMRSVTTSSVPGTVLLRTARRLIPVILGPQTCNCLSCSGDGWSESWIVRSTYTRALPLAGLRWPGHAIDQPNSIKPAVI